MPPALVETFHDFVRGRAFPCVGAKAALGRGTLRTLVCRDITSAWDDLRIYAEILKVAQSYSARPELFVSLAVLFAGPRALSEAAFEAALWERAQSLSEKDAFHGQPYDPAVSADPDNPHFSLSFGAQAFFVVGLHPHASRPARRFETPALVFNLHDQFEALRRAGRYEPMRAAILDRDMALAGSVNPMLARHGESSEARQYSGRAVSREWSCPFSPQRREQFNDEPYSTLLRDGLPAEQGAGIDRDRPARRAGG